MRLSTSVRSILLAGSALGLLAACSDAEVQSPGSIGPVTVNPPGTGGGGSGNTQRDLVPNDNCPTGTTRTTVTSNNVDLEVCRIPGGNITQDLTLTSENAYALGGPVFVGVDGGADAVLTIQPGTVIFGSTGDSALIVTRGSRIEAAGTPSAPIVLTSAEDVADGSVDDGLSNGNPVANAQWGGLIINGRAPINACSDTALTGGDANCTKSGEGNSGLFGGNLPNDNSGTYQYLRVQYAGDIISGTNELNGIAFQGVGAGTTVDHIQVYNNADDGIEWFGGTVSASYVVVNGAEDDALDWTDGWTGNLQFALVTQAAGSGNRGIEADNREGAPDRTPRSNPTISNMTLIGRNAGGENDGIKLRRGTEATIINSIITNFSLDGFDFDDDSTIAADPVVNSSLFAGNGVNIENSSGSQAVFAAGSLNEVAPANTLNGVFPGPTELAVTPTNPTGLGLAAGNYVGAFSSTEDETNNWAAGWTVGLNFTGIPDSCPTGTFEVTTNVAAVFPGRTEARICRLPSTVTSDLTLTRGNLYQITGPVNVGEDAGGDAANPAPVAQVDLTIEPGITIYAEDSVSALFVQRGSRLFANGTRQAPIIMTSKTDLDGTVTAASRNQWGGLVINGRAPINACSNTALTGGDANCEKSGEGNSGLFGGNDITDNSGRLSYVRVMYPGQILSGTNELNGIAFQGVGEMDVDYVQVHNSGDDGVEFFGGNVSVKHFIVTGAEDDSFDWTDGWTGNVQYAIVIQSNGANRGIEADSREGAPDRTPRSNPKFSNFTFIGLNAGSENDGIKLRRGTEATMLNGIVTNFALDGLDFDDDSALAADPIVNSTLFAANGVNVENSAGSQAVFTAGANNVDSPTITLAPGVGATQALVLTAPAVTPTNANTAIGSFFDNTAYVGAVEDANDDWYLGWTFGL